jgi:hypothetical protein
MFAGSQTIVSNIQSDCNSRSIKSNGGRAMLAVWTLPVKQQPVKQQPVKQQPVKQQPVKQQPVKQQPTATAHSGVATIKLRMLTRRREGTKLLVRCIVTLCLRVRFENERSARVPDDG